MERYIFTIMVLVGFYALSVAELSAQSSETPRQRAYNRAYHQTQERIDREQNTALPDFNYHIEGTFSLSGAFALNDFSPAFKSIERSRYVPSLSARFLFFGSGESKYGLEASVAYANALQARRVLYSVGLASGRYKELLPSLFYGSHYGVGYTSGVVDRVLPDNEFTSVAHGVYLSKGFSVIYKTSYKSAFGINLSMNGYYLWDWHHKGLKPENQLPRKRGGFGLYPTIGITYYIGGL